MFGSENYLYRDPWSLEDIKDFKPNNLYICLSGNSGSGKSTTLRMISEAIFQKDNQTIAIDEKAIHHPFLPFMFHDPYNYGYEIQINFMIQRALLIKKWIDFGYNLVMERSHLEDIIFIKHFYKLQKINKKEYDSYNELWDCIDKRLPHPDFMIFFNYTPELSFTNISNDEKCGKRPIEFPNEDAKKEWIYSWHELYKDLLFHANTKFKDTEVIQIKENEISSSIINDILKSVR